MTRISFGLCGILLIAVTLFNSCSNDTITQPGLNETLLFEKAGLVDSAVVYGCYAYTLRYFIEDTLNLSGYTGLRGEFDGYSTSDFSTISLLYNTGDSSNVLAYAVNNASLDGFHSFEFARSADMMWFELRLYLNPQVCGENEFKYTRARDLRIYGTR